MSSSLCPSKHFDFAALGIHAVNVLEDGRRATNSLEKFRSQVSLRVTGKGIGVTSVPS